MLKPFFVELKWNAVVMAETLVDAMVAAEQCARDICSDAEPETDAVVEVASLEHLTGLDREWDGDCVPYGGDGNTRLKELLPEKTPFKDTATADLFAQAANS